MPVVTNLVCVALYISMLAWWGGILNCFVMMALLHFSLRAKRACMFMSFEIRGLGMYRQKILKSP